MVINIYHKQKNLTMSKQLSLNFKGTHVQNDSVSSFDSSAAEIAAYHAKNNNVYVTNSYTNCIDVINIDNPSSPELEGSISLSQPPTSVAIHKNILAVALINSTSKQLPGNVAFYNIRDGNSLIVSLLVGSLPDSVFFSPNGKKVVICNEGEPDGIWNAANTGLDHNPEGTVSVVNINEKVCNLTQDDVTQLDFNTFDRETLRDAGVKITGPGSDDGDTTLSQYMEPEYAAISDDSNIAYVVLQENNALAVVDLVGLSVTSVLPLGLIDRSLAEFALDASNKNPLVDIKPWHDLVSLRQPDSIAYFRDNFVNYVVTANEGDAQDYDSYSEEARVKDLPLDPVVFPDAATLQLDENLGRLKVTTELGKNANQLYDKIYSYGGRSFSIFSVSAALELTFDSGAQFEKITAVALPKGFNSSNDQNGKKNRSDDKGPEPEAITVFNYRGARYALIGLERVGGVMVYDLSDLNDVHFVQYINNRNFNLELSEDVEGDPAPTARELSLIGDLGPESILFVQSRHNDNPLVIVANEVSGSLSIYKVNHKKSLPVCVNKSLVEGALSAILSVETSAAVQWVQQNSQNFNVLSGETSNTLSLPNVDASDTSVYFALVTDNCNDITQCVSSQRVTLN